jgi:hypothetical protein
MYAAEGAKRLNKQLNLHVAGVLFALQELKRKRDAQSYAAIFPLYTSYTLTLLQRRLDAEQRREERSHCEVLWAQHLVCECKFTHYRCCFMYC